MTPSELFTVMVGRLRDRRRRRDGRLRAACSRTVFPSIAGHLLAASVMNAPAGLMLSPRSIRPESRRARLARLAHVAVEKPDANVIDAAASGAAVGVQLALNVGAMLIAFIALIAMLNFGSRLARAASSGLEGLTLAGDARHRAAAARVGDGRALGGHRSTSAA